MTHLRPLLVGSLAAVIAAPLAAQDDAAALVAKRDKKLQSEFLGKAGWLTDYDQARAAAKESGKVLFAYFTRSYAP